MCRRHSGCVVFLKHFVSELSQYKMYAEKKERERPLFCDFPARAVRRSFILVFNFSFSEFNFKRARAGIKHVGEITKTARRG